MSALPQTLLPRAVGYGWIGPECAMEGTARAHLHDGRIVQCVSSEWARLAVDAESLEAPAARELATRYDLGVKRLLALWTRAEVAAKLRGEPSLVAFREGSATDPTLTIITAEVDDVVVSVGWSRSRRAGSSAFLLRAR